MHKPASLEGAMDAIGKPGFQSRALHPIYSKVRAINPTIVELGNPLKKPLKSMPSNSTETSMECAMQKPASFEGAKKVEGRKLPQSGVVHDAVKDELRIVKRL